MPIIVPADHHLVIFAVSYSNLRVYRLQPYTREYGEKDRRQISTLINVRSLT